MLERYKQLSVATRASLWALVAGIFQKGISVLSTPIFTRLLTTEEYAQFNLYQSWHDIFIIFASLYVYNYATYTAMAKYEDDRDGFISSAQTFVTGLTIVCFIIYYIVHIFVGDIMGFSLPIVILMFLDMLFVSAFNLWAAKERYDFRIRILTILSIVVGSFGPFLGVILTFCVRNKGYGRIYGIVTVNILVGVIVYIYNLRKAPHTCFNKDYWRYIISFCVPLIPHFLSAQILTRFDRIMINSMCGASKTGIYSLAYSLSMVMSIVSDAVLKAFTPWTYQAIKSGNRHIIKKSTSIVILLVAFVNIALILFAPEAIKLFATEEYFEAIYIIPAVSASVYYTFLYNIYANIEYYYSETKFMAWASILAAILNVLLNYIFIPIFGFIAAGYTTLASYILYAVGHFVFMKKAEKKYVEGYKFYNNTFILIVSVLFTIVSLLIIVLYRHTFWRYIVILIVIIVVILNRNKIACLISDIK